MYVRTFDVEIMFICQSSRTSSKDLNLVMILMGVQLMKSLKPLWLPSVIQVLCVKMIILI